MEEKDILKVAIVCSVFGIIALFFVSNVFSARLQLDGPFLVTNVVDGDTLDLDNGERIRLSGINTPETGECYYAEAKEALEELVLGEEVYLEKDKSDIGKYGRELRYVYLDDLMVNAYLVENSYAKVYDKYKDDTKRYEELKALEPLKGGVWDCVDPKEGCLYVASKNSKIYHKPKCKWAKKIKPENLICFHSEEELEGYEPAKSC